MAAELEPTKRRRPYKGAQRYCFILFLCVGLLVLFRPHRHSAYINIKVGKDVTDGHRVRCGRFDIDDLDRFQVTATAYGTRVDERGHKVYVGFNRVCRSVISLARHVHSQ